jgi:hypothetical protein
MKRRQFLQSLGATALSFPCFSNLALHGAEVSNAPRRLVCIGMDFGLRPESFFPTGEGPDLALTPLLKPLGKWSKRMTVFSQLEHPNVQGGHYGVHAFLSGVRREQGANYADGCISIDQMVANKLGGLTRFPSLCLGVAPGDSISWTSAGIAVPKIEHPGAAYDLLFKPMNKTAQDAQRKRLDENQSVIGLLQQDAKRVAPHLDRWDREKLDEFIGAMRDFEKSNGTSLTWVDQPIPKPDGAKPNFDPSGCMDRLRATFDVAALALQSDSTRIITLNIGGSLPVTNIPGVNRGYHDLSHSGQDPDKLRQLALVESSLMAELDHFLEKLSGMKDIAGGNVLDNTTVIFGSGMGNASSHANTNLPVVLAGGGFRHGKHLFFPKKGRQQTPLCNLFVSVLQQMGLERDRFGSSSGNLNQMLL